MVVLKTGVDCRTVLPPRDASDAGAGQGSCGRREQERAARRASSLYSATPQLLALGSHTDTSCTSRFQGNSSRWTAPALEDLPISLGRAEARQSREREMKILSPVCATSPRGQAATLQEGRGGRESLAWAAGTESSSEEVGTPWST